MNDQTMQTTTPSTDEPKGPNEAQVMQTAPQRPVHEVGDRPVLAPAVDIYENEAEYLVLADLPGVTEQDVDLDLERGELTLFAKRAVDADVDAEALSAERREGDFRRVFRIPDEVDPARVEAKLDGGVLQVRLPKSERNRPRKISINAVA